MDAGESRDRKQAAVVPVEPEYLTDVGVALLLSVSRRQVRAMVEAGRLPKPVRLSRRCSRWSRRAVLEALEEMKR